MHSIRYLLTCWLGVFVVLSSLSARAQTASDEIRASAEALGGVERILAIRNITLTGYGQWAYQYGGGNITGDPNAPQKWGAANDLRRVYDLQNDRYQLFERRNYLFPFAGTRGHAFTPTNQILDGKIAYNVLPDGTATRVGDTAEGPAAPTAPGTAGFGSCRIPLTHSAALSPEPVSVKRAWKTVRP